MEILCFCLHCGFAVKEFDLGSEVNLNLEVMNLLYITTTA